MPLHIEILYNEYNFVGGVRSRTLLMLLAGRNPRREDPR